jgi:hypothetical protein
MGILDLFRKDEVVGAKVLVCALATRFDDLLKVDAERTGGTTRQPKPPYSQAFRN